MMFVLHWLRKGANGIQCQYWDLLQTPTINRTTGLHNMQDVEVDCLLFHIYELLAISANSKKEQIRLLGFWLQDQGGSDGDAGLKHTVHYCLASCSWYVDYPYTWKNNIVANKLLYSAYISNWLTILGLHLFIDLVSSVNVLPDTDNWIDVFSVFIITNGLWRFSVKGTLAFVSINYSPEKSLVKWKFLWSLKTDTFH